MADAGIRKRRDNGPTLDEFFAHQRLRIEKRLDRVQGRYDARRRERTRPALQDLLFTMNGPVAPTSAMGPKRPTLEQLEGEVMS
jgi:hypothetical protein